MLPTQLPPVLVLFRQDLRLSDNPALQAAIETCRPVIPVYIWSPLDEGRWVPGETSRWWLYHSLQDLDAQLRQIGSRLILRNGDYRQELYSLLRETGARTVLWNRRYEAEIRDRDAGLKRELRYQGIGARSFNASLLVEPHEVTQRDGSAFVIFSSFWRAVGDTTHRQPVSVCLEDLRTPAQWPRSDTLDSLDLVSGLARNACLRANWDPSRASAENALANFCRTKCMNYSQKRNRVDDATTSRLSPYLHFGQLGPREVQAAILNTQDVSSNSVRKFITELGWREFSYHLLYHCPTLPQEPLRSWFETFPSQENERLQELWRQGRTGFPLVDAGMREMWHTGWMHNRARMITASFFVKDLMQPWQAGQQWFWQMLVDADVACNAHGWQWTSGCGTDGAALFRVFHPVEQGRKFDPSGEYVRRWIPELRRMPTEHIHAPWEADEDTLHTAGVVLGENYPFPVVDHSESRERARKVFEELSENVGNCHL